jgi:DNA (cytosine-5)-methyltransferase 1
MLNVLDLFSGIGGFSLGLERTRGFKTVAFCEIDEFCRSVLAKHWENIPIFEDVTTITEQQLAELGRIDVVCGGFPCQPVSISGLKCGENDERWMWPEFYRIICMVKPKYVLVENVVGLLSIQSGRLFGGILRDLAKIGYDAEWQVLSASQFGLSHVRKRMFLVAYSHGIGLDKIPVFKNINDKIRTGEFSAVHSCTHIDCIGRAFPEIPEHLRSSDGISERLDRSIMGTDYHAGPTHIIQKRIKSLGNAIVPQCAQFVGQCIIDAEYQNL